MPKLFIFENRFSIIKALAIFAILILSISTASAASICYKVTLNDGTSWQICRDTTNLDFKMDGYVQGNGFIVENKDVNLAKVGLKATTKSMPENSNVMDFNAESQVYSEQNLNVHSEIVNSTYSYKASGSGNNESADFTTTMIFPVKIDYSTKLTYSGKEIRSKEFVFDNYKGVTTKVEGSNVTKQSNANVDVDFIYAKAHLEPGVVNEALFTNSTIDYNIDSYADGLSKFCAKYYDASIDESYYGNFNMKKGVKMVTKIPLPEEATKDWLSCPK